MSERARRRSSKWDFKEENSFSPEHVHIPHGEVQKASTWDEDRDYGTRMSPGNGDWRRQRDRSLGEKLDNRSSRNIRSRSRSRSPGHGIRQESLRNERSRSRPCKDFSVGRCRKGDDCPFVHQGTQNYEDRREIGARRGEISRNSNPHDFRDQHTGRRGNDCDIRPPCKFFAAGNCRSGKSCRFSHSESPERRLDDEKSMLCHNSDKATKVSEHPRFSVTSSVPDAVRYDDSRGGKRARHSRDNNEWSPDGKRVPHFEPDQETSEKVLGDLAMSPDWNYDSSTQVKDEIQHTDNETSLEKTVFNRLENPGFSQNNLKFSINDWDGPNSNQEHYKSWDGIAPTTLTIVGKHNMQDSTTPEIIKNTVDGVQFPQLANVSGSLAQLLGDGKQLPLNSSDDMLGNSSSPIESKGVGNNGQPENTGTETKDEEKKSKETKATRVFKFGLAEYVKELLKPSWKEGIVGKDDYKTIVKKVVDKVTESFQGPNIPQTREKIDSYLTLSKPKLTKLIQAYVEKFQKPK